MSKELTAFKKHFENHINIKVVNTIETSNYPHWKRLCFFKLNCEQLEEVTRYIRNTFSVMGKYTHNLVDIVPFDGYLALTVDIKLIQKHIINK